MVNFVTMQYPGSARLLLRASVFWAVLVSSMPAGAEPNPPLSPSHVASGEAKPSGYDFSPGVPCPYCGITPRYPEGRKGLHWHSHWNTVGVREYIVTPLAAAVAFAVPALVNPARGASWDGPILFDRGARNLLRLNDPGARKSADDVSDVLYVFAYTQPIFDVLVVAWWLRDAPEVAWQMGVIDAQAYALTMALNVVTKRLTSRARPWLDECESDPTGASCGEGGAFSSFYSGHASLTATGAGLICAHHTQLSLYKEPWLDAGACVAGVLGTAITGAMRIASDNHWASDVIVGHIMGYLSGYLMPTLLYYRDFSFTPHDHDAPPDAPRPQFTLLPIVGPSSAQLAVFGLF